MLSCAFYLSGIATIWFIQKLRGRGAQQLMADILQRAQCEAETLLRQAELTAQQQQLAKQRELEAGWQVDRRKLQKEEERLKEREDRLDKRLGTVDKKLQDLVQNELDLKKREIQLGSQEQAIHQKQAQLMADLERLAGLTMTDAKQHLLQRLEQQLQSETFAMTRRAQREAEEECERLTQRILVTSINRLAVPCVSEATVTTVAIPSDEIKGRIIGREGRNIRTFERLTGVNVLIDDTPGAIVLSGFDPIRKQIAKMALTDLIQDGRIHPTRIEEATEKAQLDMEKQIRFSGQDAAARAGIVGLHPDLISLLGKLKFRYSYGQNVLDHSVEVAHLMGLMALELGLDAALAKRIGLLHDVGKALSHEVEGTHAIVGRDFALKCGERAEVANGIGCHHGEIEPITLEGSLCAAADALSASRPGARIEAVEEYLKRLKQLEEIAYSFPGVERAYAMQAGREVHVSVLPDQIDDQALLNLARDITKRIEQELTYPGKIKVTLVREKRTSQYAV